MNEIWKDIEGYHGVYKVSSLGRISVVRQESPYIMKQKPSKDGYVRILLFKGGKYKSEYVHILVAKAFVGGYEKGLEVNHIDANKSNNRADNLEWVTPRENHFHAVRMGLKPVCPTLGKHGADNPRSKPVLQFDVNGNFIRKWACREEAAKFYGCHRSTIGNCVNGYKRTCKGFIWKNA